MPVSRPYSSDSRRVAEMIRADLARIGVRAQPQDRRLGRLPQKLQAGETPMALFGWTGDNGDPDNFMNVLLGCAAARSGGNNIAKWCDAEYEALVRRAKQVAGPGRSASASTASAQVIFHREAPWVALAHSVVFMAARREVEGLPHGPARPSSFRGRRSGGVNPSAPRRSRTLPAIASAAARSVDLSGPII